ncbi:putative leader peptide [Nocardioides palaemonis]
MPVVRPVLPSPATVGDLLTQRRAVDLVRTGSALCRRSSAVD